MPLRNLVWLVVVPAFVALGLAISYSAPPPDKDYRLVRQFVDVLAEVDANFYRELSDEERQQLVEDMIALGLHKLDPHSTFFNEKQLKQFETEAQGSFGGVGMMLTLDPPTELLKVDHPLPGTPAYEAGIAADDLIVAIDGKSTKGITVPEARKQITGEPGTKVTVTTRRAGRDPADVDVTLKRAQVKQHPVSGVRRSATDPGKWEWVVDTWGQVPIGYVRILAFNDLTTDELKAAVADLEKAGARGLVLDLRGNPGGLLSQAIGVSDLFLNDGKIVSTTDRRSRDRAFNAKKDDTVFQPAEQKFIAVLVDGDSASASEIVAAALQDHKRAVIVGERTFGKGSVQKLLRLSSEPPSAVKLTTERYWRPSGANMDKMLAPKDSPDVWGVRPDVEVPTSKKDKFRLDVEQLKVQWVAGRPDAVKPRPAPTPRDLEGKPLIDDSEPFVDAPLKKAVEIIKGKLGGNGQVAPPAAAPGRARPPVFAG